MSGVFFVRRLPLVVSLNTFLTLNALVFVDLDFLLVLNSRVEFSQNGNRLLTHFYCGCVECFGSGEQHVALPGMAVKAVKPYIPQKECSMHAKRRTGSP